MEIRDYAADDPLFRRIVDRGRAQSDEAGAAATAIVRDVRDRGDDALLEYTRRFDRAALTPATLRASAAEFDQARHQVDTEYLTALSLARANIRHFHEYQKRQGYDHSVADGTRLSRVVLPLASVGVYCPAGGAPLVSSMLMGVVPAQVAGVQRICVAIPPRPDGSIHPHMLMAAHALDIDEVYKMGGAQAIAALAYGTASVAAVDKVVGPGNVYVTRAKREVWGQVGIDQAYGPSEAVIVADRAASARFAAIELLAQAEHGSGYEMAVLLTDDRSMAAAVKIEMERGLADLDAGAQEKIRIVLDRFAGLFVCRDLEEAIQAANRLAPEHLVLMTRRDAELLPDVVHAGAVFVGPWSPVAVGDFYAGTNHILPTGGAARHASGCGVSDFVREMSIIEYSAKRLAHTGQHVIKMAETEGLPAHAAAIRARLEDMLPNHP